MAVFGLRLMTVWERRFHSLYPMDPRVLRMSGISAQQERLQKRMQQNL